MSTPVLDERIRRRRGWLVTAAVAVVLAVGLTAVWGLGGFGARQDLLTPVAPGTALDTGPYEITVSSATVQHKPADHAWDVVVQGTGRTVGDTTIVPPTDDDAFMLAQDRTTREVQPASDFTLGSTDESRLFVIDSFTPGLAPIPFTATFAFTSAPSGTIRVVVYQQEYTTAYVFGDEKAWRNTTQAYDLTLPLRALPDATS